MYFWGRNLHYSFFLGAYGILLAILNIVSMLVSSFASAISTLLLLLMNSIGAALFLAGGVAWAVVFKNMSLSCSQMAGGRDVNFSHRFIMSIYHACIRCNAIEILLFCLFPLSLALVFCFYVLRRGITQSRKEY